MTRSRKGDPGQRARNVRWYAENREYAKQKAKKWYHNNRERARKAHRNAALKRRYGITREQYEVLFRAQNGRCAICGEPERQRDRNGRVKELSVDHDHVTSKIRSLLCGDCNLLIGNARERADILVAAIRYLHLWEAREPDHNDTQST